MSGVNALLHVFHYANREMPVLLHVRVPKQCTTTPKTWQYGRTYLVRVHLDSQPSKQ